MKHSLLSGDNPFYQKKVKASNDHNLPPEDKYTLGLDEKLTKSDDMGDWIDDFKKSDAPQFDGKSDEKKRQMAIAAKLDADSKGK